MTRKIKESSITDSWGGRHEPKVSSEQKPGEKHIQDDPGHQSEVAIQIFLDA